MTTLPENILRCMSQEARLKGGKGFVLKAEAQAKFEKRAERTIQKQIEQLCQLRGLFYYRVPMHKRSPMPAGWPDFLIMLPHGKTLLVEVKTDSGKLSDEQKKFFERYQTMTGDYVRLVRSLEEFRAVLDEATKTKEI